jgi:DMSO/TMAO reductase YedYZ heme-binding membrane subunit
MSTGVREYRTIGTVIAMVALATFLFYTGAREGESLPSLGRLGTIFSFADPEKTQVEFRKAFGLVAMSLLSLSLVLGPLCRLSSSRLSRALLCERKRLGLAACVFAMAHVALSLGSWQSFVSELGHARAAKVCGIAAASVATLILSCMAATSTRGAMIRLGAARWKRLHSFGVVALVLAITHFVCMETDPGRGLHVRFYALVILGLAVTVAIMRGLDFIGAARKLVGDAISSRSLSAAPGATVRRGVDDPG